MAKFNWVVITREDVIRAIERFLVNNPEYPDPREYSNAIVHAFQKFRVLPQLSVNGIETKVLK